MQVFNQLYALLPPDVAGNITLQPVNIADEAGYRSELVLPEIQSAVAGYTAQGVNRFVLNMSFVFVPCRSDELGFDFAEVAERRRNDPEYSIVEDLGGDPQYVRSVLTDSRISYIEADRLVTTQEEATPRGNSALQVGGGRQIPPTPAAGAPQFRGQDLRVLRLLDNTNLQSDPLRDFLRQARDVTIIPVASSGNFKQRQPFYPARWPEVISVSANEGNDLRFWLHSNNGDISVPGAWYRFDDEAYRAGTSFAAPVVSVLIALDLTQTEPTCSVRGNSPVLARGSYDNTPIADAVRQYC
jgi:hypothetical protein